MKPLHTFIVVFWVGGVTVFTVGISAWIWGLLFIDTPVRQGAVTLGVAAVVAAIVGVIARWVRGGAGESV